MTRICGYRRDNIGNVKKTTREGRCWKQSSVGSHLLKLETVYIATNTNNCKSNTLLASSSHCINRGRSIRRHSVSDEYNLVILRSCQTSYHRQKICTLLNCSSCISSAAWLLYNIIDRVKKIFPWWLLSGKLQFRNHLVAERHGSKVCWLCLLLNVELKKAFQSKKISHTYRVSRMKGETNIHPVLACYKRKEKQIFKYNWYAKSKGNKNSGMLNKGKVILM